MTYYFASSCGTHCDKDIATSIYESYLKCFKRKTRALFLNSGGENIMIGPKDFKKWITSLKDPLCSHYNRMGQNLWFQNECLPSYIMEIGLSTQRDLAEASDSSLAEENYDDNDDDELLIIEPVNLPARTPFKNAMDFEFQEF